MDKTFNRHKWASLISFALMYNFVYLGRFNVNNMMSYIADDFSLSAQQQEIIGMSVFVCYALGSFINGYLADHFGAKKIIIIGGLMTCIFNICIALGDDWTSVLLAQGLNGYFQSMIWVGGVSLLAKWWKEGERGKGIGIANFFSGMSHTTAYLLPIVLMTLFHMSDWRSMFIAPIGVLFAFVIIFGLAAKESPESIGAEPYEIENERHKQREQELNELAKENKAPFLFLFRQKNFWWWCTVAMLSSICRYGLLNWIPLYYNNENGTSIISESFSSLTLPIGMAFGTLAITWFAGTKMFNNKGVIITAMAAICATLIIAFPMIGNAQSVLVGIFFAGFTLYGINGILWLHAIDQGCRPFAGSVAGIFNGFAYLGACIEGYLFPMVIKLFDSSLTVFVVMELLCIFMVICGMKISKKNTIVEPEIHS